MKINLRRLFKNEFILLTLFLLKQWFTLKHLNNHYNSYNKQKYILNNDTEFLQKYKTYYESSQQAYKDMQNWLKSSSPSNSQLLFNQKNVTLCVGVLSKKRYTDIGLNAPFESVVTMLVRTRLKYQNDVRIDLIDVEEAESKRDDLKDLRGLVNIVELRLDLFLL